MRPFIAFLFALSPSAVLAHPGGHFGQPFWDGVTHPFLGTDHLLVMFAVGLWAVTIGGRQVWQLPLAFMVALLSGGILGAQSVVLPALEPMILVSVLLMGIAVALALRPPVVASIGLVALFGLAHGFAHGAEAPQFGLAGYASGFVLASGFLHLAGMSIGGLLQRKAARFLGAGVAFAGLALAFA